MPIRVDARQGDANLTRPRGFVAWWRGHRYAIAFTIMLVATGVMVLRKRSTEFESVFVLTAQHLMAGRGMFRLDVAPFDLFTYPPVNALLAIPFALVPATLGRVAWYLLLEASILALFCGAWKLAGGGRLQGTGVRIDRREHFVAILGLICAVPLILSGVDHQQTDLLIAALLMGGCLALTRSRAMLAATAFGVAAGLKCTPLLFAPYLAWRGRWKAAAWLVAVAVGINLLPDLVHGPKGGGLWLVEWFETYLRPMGRADYLPGRWYAWILDNQSLAGALNRWTTTRCLWTGTAIEVLDRAQPLLSGETLRPLAVAVEGLVLLVACYALGRPGASAPAAEVRPGPSRDVIEHGMILMLMLLFSPMSSRPHFATVLLPALALARVAIFGKQRVAFGFLAAALLSGTLAGPFWGQAVSRLSMWCGMLTWCTFFLLAGCVWTLRSDALSAVHAAAGEDATLAARPHPDLGTTSGSLADPAPHA